MKKSRFKVNHDTVHPYVDEAMLEVTENKVTIPEIQQQIAHCSATGFANTLLLAMAQGLNVDELHDLCKIQNLIVLQTYKNWTFDHDRPETHSQNNASAKADWLQIPLRWLRKLVF